MRDIAGQMTNGECGEVTVQVTRGSETMELNATRVRANGLARAVHDQPGDTFRILPSNIAYLKLSSVKADEVESYIDRAAASKGLIIDIRNYPSELVVLRLGSLLVNRPTDFARFTAGDLTSPGTFRWEATSGSLTPGTNYYGGKVMILVDEVSVSQAELTAMAFRSAAQAKVVGSTTAGADGNISTDSAPRRPNYTGSPGLACSTRTKDQRSESVFCRTLKSNPQLRAFVRAATKCLMRQFVTSSKLPLPRHRGVDDTDGASRLRGWRSCDLSDALHASARWRVFRQREMRARSVVVQNLHLALACHPPLHDHDDAGTIGLCRTVHGVERERQTVLVPTHDIRRHGGLTRGCRTSSYQPTLAVSDSSRRRPVAITSGDPPQAPASSRPHCANSCR